ncbi:MAG: iron-containing alcohol dehydrogenase [Xanthomonadales bacterium]|nr:iron-containing alcohol dehydrogenase [Xanthomonadales bacterium]
MLHSLLVGIKKPFLKHFPVPTPECITGAQSVKRIADQLNRYKGTCPLIVTDNVLLELGLISPVFKSLDSNGIAYHVFSEIEPDPDFEAVRMGVERYQQKKCDSLILIGGGSVLDCGKAIAASVAKKKDIGRLVGLLRVHRTVPPMIAIPTTAGTGSECTVAAVITDRQQRIKKVVADPFLVPKCAILDPTLMTGLPAQITAHTGIDALTHAIESYLSGYAGRFSKKQSIQAIKAVFSNLPVAYENGQDLDAREAMALASYQAGLAFTRTYVGYVHAIAHQLGAIYHVPHGLANAIVLPEVLAYCRPKIDHQLAELAREANISDSPDNAQAASVFMEELNGLLQKLDIPKTVAAMKSSEIDQIAQRALEEAFGQYPVPVQLCHTQIREILLRLLPA